MKCVVDKLQQLPLGAKHLSPTKWTLSDPGTAVGTLGALRTSSTKLTADRARYAAACLRRW